jgi:predicted transcriptional regulator
MEYLRDFNTQKSIRAMSARMKEDGRKLAELVARGLLEPSTNATRGILTELVLTQMESATILDKLVVAVASQDQTAIEQLMRDHALSEA